MCDCTSGNDEPITASSPSSRDNLTPCDGAARQHLPQRGRDSVSEHSKMELDRHFAWFEGRLPPRLARFVGWLRKPSSRLRPGSLALFVIVWRVFRFFTRR